jgi:hypothetical protein
LPTNDSLAASRFLKVRRAFIDQVAPNVPSSTGTTEAGLLKVCSAWNVALICERCTRVSQGMFLKECYSEARDSYPEAMESDMDKFDEIVASVAQSFPGMLQRGRSASYRCIHYVFFSVRSCHVSVLSISC